MHLSSTILVLASAFLVGSYALNMYVLASHLVASNNTTHYLHSVTHEPSSSSVPETDSHRPREALPKPAGCNGGSYRATNATAAAAECTASGCKSCLAPFENQGYYYAICECNVSDSLSVLRSRGCRGRLIANSERNFRQGLKVGLRDLGDLYGGSGFGGGWIEGKVKLDGK